MFIGEFSHSIDQKKRLSIPARFRKELGKRVVITIGLDKCLFVWSYPEWSKFAKKLGAENLGKANVRVFVRSMLTGAMEVEVDGLGRILIPDYLKVFAALAKKVVVTGVYNRLELWDEQIWQEYKTRANKDVDAMAEQLQNVNGL